MKKFRLYTLFIIILYNRNNKEESSQTEIVSRETLLIYGAQRQPAETK